jgi:Domain of unknown function (DUF4398)
MNLSTICRVSRGTPRLGLPAAIAAAALLAVACASTPPPTDQVALGTAAVARAAAAGGDELAPADMRMARDKMQRANVALIAKDYPEALALAQRAQVDARLAEARAQSGKAVKAATAVREDNRALREEIERKAPQ